MQEKNYCPIKYAMRYIYGHLENPQIQMVIFLQNDGSMPVVLKSFLHAVQSRKSTAWFKHASSGG